MSILSIRDIHKSFGTLEVLKGIDTDIAHGEMVSIVGASGAGKTTLLQVMGTLLRPDEGTITLGDTDVTRLSTLRSRASAIATLASSFSSTSSCPSSPPSRM